MVNNKMPKGKHNNHKTGRRSKCICHLTSPLTCRPCIRHKYYMKHRENERARSLGYYWDKKGIDPFNDNLDQRMNDYFKEKGLN